MIAQMSKAGGPHASGVLSRRSSRLLPGLPGVYRGYRRGRCSAAGLHFLRLVSFVLIFAAGVLVARSSAAADACAPSGYTDPVLIEGYADRISVYPGETINFYVHFNGVGVPGEMDYLYWMDFYRLGAQMTFTGVELVEIGGPQCIPLQTRESRTGYTSDSDAGWYYPVSFQIPSGWSGFYTARLMPEYAPNTYSDITFIVKDRPAARKSIALVASTNTWAAYNIWPYSRSALSLGIYQLACSTAGSNDITQANRYCINALASPSHPSTSFLKPNPWASPDPYLFFANPPALGLGTFNPTMDYAGVTSLATEHLLSGELRVAGWLEQNGYGYSLLSDYDLDQAGQVSPVDALTPAVTPTIVLSTHNEYWTSGMYAAVKSFQAAGGNLVSLSGNTMNGRVAYDGAPGTAHWEMTNDSTDGDVPSWLPNYGLPVAQWMESAKTTPSSLLGQSWINPDSFITGHNGYATCYPYIVNNARHWVFAGDSVAAGDALGTFGVVSYQGTHEGANAPGRRSFCSTGIVGAAAGWETDEATPPFARTFNRIAKAEANPSNNDATMVFMKQTAGEVFSVGSITFGQSLAQDYSLVPVLRNILRRFSRPRFGDFTGDGVPDVLARNSLTKALRLYPGAVGAGVTISDPSGRGWGAYNQLLPIGDFDSDGFSDVLGRTSDGRMYLFCGNGGGNFCSNQYTCPLPSATTAPTRCTAAVPVPQIDSGWSVISKLAAAGDFDGDGIPDLVGVKNNWLYLYSGNGAGGFVQNGGILIESNWNWGSAVFQDIVPVGDFNTDGYPDLLVRSQGASSTYLDLFVGGPPASPNGPPTLAAYADPVGCRSGVSASYPPLVPPWATTLPSYLDSGKNAHGIPNCICTMEVISSAGTRPVCHVGVGWDTVGKIVPVGNLAGDSPPVPSMLAVGKVAPYSLYLYKGWGDGSFHSASVQAGSTGWNQADIILGVW